MKIRLLIALGIVIVCLFVFGQRMAAAQTYDATHVTSVDDEINALRADLKANREDIIREAMQLKPAEADSFWPVYMQYEKEMSGVNDSLVKIVKTYAEKFGSINDADAQDLTLRFLSVEEQKIEIKKKYFPIFAKATSPLIAAKFFQADNRLELTFNIKLASELPALFIQSPPPAPAKAN